VQKITYLCLFYVFSSNLRYNPASAGGVQHILEEYAMKRFWVTAMLLLVLILVGTSLASASAVHKEMPDLVVGAQLYDKWYAVLNVSPPQGNMPIWSRQSTNTRSGADTWRCSECHGWDYKGVNGAYGSGSHKTGFPSLMILVPQMTREEIVAHLKGGKDPAHDFSPYLDDQSLQRLALFLKEGLIDDSEYIDAVSLKVINGDVEHGKQLFQEVCAKCHGDDGKKIIFRTEGIEETLGAVARRDPYRFLHRTRFGVAGTEMPVGFMLGWKPADGRDVLAYAQTLPAAKDEPTLGPAGESATPAAQQMGGPSGNPILGILTGILAALGTIGSALLFLSVLVFVGAVIVFALRRRQ